MLVATRLHQLIARSAVLWALMLLCLVPVGCNTDKKSGGSTSLPSLGSDRITTSGGSATGFAFNGGDGGDVTVSATNGRLMEDDNRDRPTVGTNALDGYGPTIGGTMTVNGGDASSTTGGAAGTVAFDSDGSYQFLGTVTLNGGDGTSGGAGGALSVTFSAGCVLESAARFRANGGSPVGAAGTVDLSGGSPTLIEISGSLMETEDGDGTDQSSTNITRP